MKISGEQVSDVASGSVSNEGVQFKSSHNLLDSCEDSFLHCTSHQVDPLTQQMPGAEETDEPESPYKKPFEPSDDIPTSPSSWETDPNLASPTENWDLFDPFHFDWPNW